MRERSEEDEQRRALVDEDDIILKLNSFISTALSAQHHGRQKRCL